MPQKLDLSKSIQIDKLLKNLSSIPITLYSSNPLDARTIPSQCIYMYFYECSFTLFPRMYLSSSLSNNKIYIYWREKCYRCKSKNIYIIHTCNVCAEGRCRDPTNANAHFDFLYNIWMQMIARCNGNEFENCLFTQKRKRTRSFRTIFFCIILLVHFFLAFYTFLLHWIEMEKIGNKMGWDEGLGAFLWMGINWKWAEWSWLYILEDDGVGVA
jgi:hypothetical protein